LFELPPRDGDAVESAAWEAIAADLKQQLGRLEGRAERLERQLVDSRASLANERAAREAAEGREQQLRHEWETFEASFGRTKDGDDAEAEPLTLTLLYVGGRPAGIGYLREAAERRGAVFMHHDGGIEERGNLLPGLVSRADAVVFPVDCISHAAMSLVKRLCQQAGKPFLPLRGAGLAPFCAALNSPELRAQTA
jgi:hypothetical protein